MSDEAHAQRLEIEPARRLTLSLYRVALLLTGAEDQAELVLRASFRAMLATPDEQLVSGVQALAGWKPGRGRRWSWKADTQALQRAGISATTAQALLEELARRAPRERLMLGLVYLHGQSPAEAAGLLRDVLAITLLRDLRVTIAQGLADLDEQLTVEELRRLDAHLDEALAADEATAMRQRLLGDERLRVARAALAGADALLARALPLLFAVAPPAELSVALRELPATTQAARSRPRWLLSAALATGVLLILLVLLVLPQRRPATAAPPVGAVTAIERDPYQLVEAAIHRLDRPPRDQGVLHEIYRLSGGERPLVLERWYEYAPPHRLKLSVTYEGEEQPLFAVASDGERQVQYGFGNAQGSELRRISLSASAAEVERAIPLLRQLPMFNLLLGWSLPGYSNPSHYYLGRASESALTSLGSTSYLSRSAELVAFAHRSWASQGGPAVNEWVVLTIDHETFALLEVTIFPQSDGAVSSRHPWRAQLVEVLAELPPGALRLPPSRNEVQVADVPLHSPRLPQYLANGGLINLDKVLGMPGKLLLPRHLPFADPQAVIIDTGAQWPQASALIIIEHEFGSLAIVGAESLGQRRPKGELRKAGAYSYILPVFDDDERAVEQVATLAAVLDAAGEAPVAGLFYIDEFASPEQREQALAEVIASLEVVTEENRAQFEGYFR